MARKMLSYETLVNAVAGVGGSCIAMTLVLPLDTIRHRQVMDKNIRSKTMIGTLKELISQEGILTLYRGGITTIQCVAVSNFIYFYTFHGLKHVIESQASALKDLLFACCAGACNVIITNPIWVVNTRIKSQGTKKDDDNGKAKLKGLFDGLLKIGMHEGIESLVSGTFASLILVSNPAIKFTVYEYFKRILLSSPKSGNQLSPGKAFLIGALASACATLITYPIQVVQTKLRGQENTDQIPKDEGFFAVVRYIARNFGPFYFYKGLEAKLLQSIIVAGFMFVSYEKIAAMIFALMGIRKQVK